MNERHTSFADRRRDKNMHGSFLSLSLSRISTFSSVDDDDDDNVDAAPCPFHYRTGKRYSRDDPVLRRKIGARCGETVTYYSRATFHYTSFHSTPRTYYWHVFPLALSCVPIGCIYIGKSFFLFPPAVIRHAMHVEARSPIVAWYVLFM